MLTQVLRGKIDNLNDMLNKDLSNEFIDSYLINITIKKFVEKLKPILSSFKDALLVASDNNEIKIEITKSISDQAASLSPDISVLLGYLGQLRESLHFHWQIINRTDAAYVRHPNILISTICRDMAGICSDVFVRSGEKIHEYEFIMPGIKMIYCLKKNSHVYHQLGEFIFSDDGMTPIVVTDFYEELAQPGKFTDVIKNYSEEEIERLKNHSNEAYDYFYALKTERKISEARSGFEDVMRKDKYKITYTYGITGSARLARGLLEYADQPRKTFNEKASFILENIPSDRWLHYLQTLTQNVDDQGKIADAIYFKVCTSEFSEPKYNSVVKLLRATILKTPIEIADFMIARVPDMLWSNFIDILNNKKKLNEKPVSMDKCLPLLNEEVKMVAALLFNKTPQAAHGFVRLIISEIVDSPLSLANFLQHYCTGCAVFKDLTQAILPKMDAQKALIKFLLQKINNENEFLVFLRSIPNAKENWSFILGLIEPTFLFSLFLNAKDAELLDFNILKSKLEILLTTYFDRPFISNEKYQSASFYTLTFIYDLIRNQLPVVLSWTARMVGSESARSSSSKINAAKALRDDIADMVDKDKIDLNIEGHSFFSEYSSAFGNGALLKMINAIKQTNEILVRERMSNIQIPAMQ